jgi:phosphoribosylglycinamide formyltransferase-1
MSRPKILVFATGTKEGGGSGFENLVLASRGENPVLDAEIVGVVSNFEKGGVSMRASKLGVPFFCMEKPYTAEAYQHIISQSEAEWVALSGWLKKTIGLNSQKTFNIHPGPLSVLHGRFGGVGMYGHFVHEAVHKAFLAGELTASAATMHFVTDEYDRGPVFFEYPVPVTPGMTPEDIQHAVHMVEHEWQPRITNMVVHGDIAWDGIDAASLVIPKGYTHIPHSHI